MARELRARFPGQVYLLSQPIEMRFNELLSGSRADISVKIFGDDYDVLMKTAGKAKEIVEKIPGAADVEMDSIGKSPVLEVTMNREAMPRYNIQAGEINRLIRTAFAGEGMVQKRHLAGYR